MINVYLAVEVPVLQVCPVGDVRPAHRDKVARLHLQQSLGEPH